VFHDDAGGLVEHAYAFDRGVGVGDVVERQLLALEHARRGHARAAGTEFAIERGTLVRVFAITQVLQLVVHQRQDLRKFTATGLATEQVRRHHGVVPRGVRERLRGQRGTRVDAGGPGVGIEIREYACVVGRIDHDGHGFMIFRRGPHHGGATDVDVFDGIGVGAIRFRDGRREWIQVHGEKVDARDVMFLHDRIVDAATAEETPVHARVQRLDAAVHDFGKPGVGGDLGHRYAGVGQRTRCTAGAENLDFPRSQCAREIDQPRLVGDRQQGPANRDQHRP
jgi:hypothetical protein